VVAIDGARVAWWKLKGRRSYCALTAIGMESKWRLLWVSHGLNWMARLVVFFMFLGSREETWAPHVGVDDGSVAAG
jgi:hypothetical protein